VTVRKTWRRRSPTSRRRHRHVSSGQGGFGSSDVEVDVTAPSADALQTATDAGVGLEGKAGIGQVTRTSRPRSRTSP
jgi:hypothetical protein